LYFGAARLISISREISKVFEETRRGTVQSILEHFTNHPAKGEIVLVISGASET